MTCDPLCEKKPHAMVAHAYFSQRGSHMMDAARRSAHVDNNQHRVVGVGRDWAALGGSGRAVGAGWAAARGPTRVTGLLQ